MGLAAVVGTGTAAANGRFPTAGFIVVGPGASNGLTAIRTTFGLVVSTDYGHDWSWVCEGAYNSVNMSDPPIAIGADGTLLVGLPGESTAVGVLGSRTLCDWTAPVGNPDAQVYDIAWSPSGSVIVLGVVGQDPTTMMEADGLSMSTDSGHTFVAGARLPNFYLETVEVAPSQPTTIYVSGYGAGGIPQLYRSDDGGMHLNFVTGNFTDPAVSGVFISGVDPTHPEVLYIRVNLGAGTRLIKSIDGGMSFTVLTSTAAPMEGFALSDDGQTVWAGSSDRTEGITRSVAGGAFTRVRANTSVACLRYHAGLLYVCGNEDIDGYSLAWSSDGGDTFCPLMSVRDVVGPVPSCGASTEVGSVCGAAWPAQDMFLRDLDAAPEATHCYYDAGNDLGVSVPDVSTTDAPFDAGSDDSATTFVDAVTPPMDAIATDRGPTYSDVMYPDIPLNHRPTPAPSPSNCGCSVPGEVPTGLPLVGVWLMAVGLRPRRRRRLPTE